MPIESRPQCSAASSVVPEPAKGSSTMSLAPSTCRQATSCASASAATVRALASALSLGTTPGTGDALRDGVDRRMIRNLVATKQATVVANYGVLQPLRAEKRQRAHRRQKRGSLSLRSTTTIVPPMPHHSIASPNRPMGPRCQAAARRQLGQTGSVSPRRCARSSQYVRSRQE